MLCLALGVGSSTAVAQGAPPPPPPPPPPSPGVAAPIAARAAAPTVKEKDVLADLQAGAAAVAQLDLAAAQGYFEQAFAKCDAASIKGPVLAKVYMALGSFYAGYLQQVPQGAAFIKLALQSDPKVETIPEVNNSQVEATVKMVKEGLGLTAPAPEEAAGPPAANSLGGFWVMRHTRVETAKRLYPMGLWAEINPMVAVNGVRLSFRTPSDRQFTVGMMQRKGNQWGLLIDCSAIALLDPKELFYYVEVIGGDNSVIANEGTASEPIKIQLVPDKKFQGQQPNLPGNPELTRCNPDDATPCPPWDPHCKDIACAGNEDCLGATICREGYCVDSESADADGLYRPIGLVIAGGVGMGVGFASGKEDGFDRCLDGLGNPAPCGSIDLDTGLSPSWMFTRAMIGYYVLDNLMLGAWARFQHLNSEEMRIAGLQVGKNDLNKDVDFQRADARGPMWGITASLFLYGDGRWMGPGQVKDERGALKDKQGFRLYSRFEFDIYGAMYHEVTLHPSEEHVCGEGQNSTTDDPCFQSTEYRQHVAGMEGVGLGMGVLYGVHRNVDIAAELMYDLLFPSIANNFDLQLGLQFHF